MSLYFFVLRVNTRFSACKWVGSSGGQSPPSQLVGLALLPRQSIWELWQTTVDLPVDYHSTIAAYSLVMRGWHDRLQYQGTHSSYHTPKTNYNPDRYTQSGASHVPRSSRHEDRMRPVFLSKKSHSTSQLSSQKEG
jgi:hypothetical protein